MNINQIKSNIQRDFARPNLFRVSFANIVASKTEVFRINCYQAQIPGNNLAITDKDTGFRSAAYHRLYSDVILGFYCSENMQELELFQNWIDAIVDPKTNQKGYYGTDTDGTGGYTTTVTIEHLSRLSSKVSDNPADKARDEENTVTAKWTLFEAFPRQVDPIQLDYGTNDTVMSMNVTLTYRHFKAYFNPIPDSVDKGIERTNKLGQRYGGGTRNFPGLLPT